MAAAVEAASRRHGGVLTAADLAAYQPAWREPVVFEAFGWKIASMPLPSSGGLLLGETLGMLERLEWAKMPRFGADRAHFLAEAFRRVYADRFLLGDPVDHEGRPRRSSSTRSGWSSGRRGIAAAPGHAFDRGEALAGHGDAGRAEGDRDHPSLRGGRRRQHGGPDHDA